MADTPEQHRARMARKKSVIDAGIAQATIERGVVIVNTGNGKGKSTAGFGMIARALGHGMKIGVVQFIKGSFSTGEEAFFKRFAEVTYHVMGEGYTWETQNKEHDIAAAQAAWQEASKMLSDAEIAVVLLDELNIALKLNYLNIAEVITLLRARPPQQHVIITGRSAPAELVEYADTVTEMKLIKHAYYSGIKAQNGVEL